MKDLIIIGASGFGREVAWHVERINACNPTWNLIGFIDDNEKLQGKLINGYPIVGTTEDINKYKDSYFVCAIGSASIRERIVHRISDNRGIKFATIIDPDAIVSDRVTVGEGTIICAGVIVTVNISIGCHCIITGGCTVGHDAVISDYVTVYPSTNISGMVHIGECVELGTGSKVIQGLQIGNNTIIGAGSVVIKDMPDNCKIVGVPARVISL